MAPPRLYVSDIIEGLCATRDITAWNLTAKIPNSTPLHLHPIIPSSNARPRDRNLSPVEIYVLHNNFTQDAFLENALPKIKHPYYGRAVYRGIPYWKSTDITNLCTPFLNKSHRFMLTLSWWRRRHYDGGVRTSMVQVK